MLLFTPDKQIVMHHTKQENTSVVRMATSQQKRLPPNHAKQEKLATKSSDSLPKTKAERNRDKKCKSVACDWASIQKTNCKYIIEAKTHIKQHTRNHGSEWARASIGLHDGVPYKRRTAHKPPQHVSPQTPCTA